MKIILIKKIFNMTVHEIFGNEVSRELTIGGAAMQVMSRVVKSRVIPLCDITRLNIFGLNLQIQI